MSNNIYNILGKLSSLEPKQEQTVTPKETVYESVEARGSILEGVAKIEKKLSEQLAALKEYDSDGKSGYKHKGKYGTEYQGDAEEEEAAEKAPKKRGRPAKGTAKKPAPAANGEKRGRGRPKKDAAPTYNKTNDLFGRVPSKAPKGKKGTVHKMESITEGVNFRKMAEETGMALDEMLEALQGDIQEYKANGSLSERLRDFVELHNHAKKQLSDAVRPEQVPAFQRKQQGQNFPVTLDQVNDQSDKISSQQGLDKLKKDMSMENELNELAKLAGLEIRESAKPDFLDMDKDGDKTEPMKKAAKDSDVEEGNEFSGALAKAKASGAKEFEVDGKKYPVSESAVAECDMSPLGGAASAMDSDNLNITTSYNSKDGRKSINISAEGDSAEKLAEILKLSGLAGSPAASSERPEVKVVQMSTSPEAVEEAQPANAPNEQVATVDAITDQGNDLNRQKKQFASSPKLGDNPMASESTNPLESLGRKLMKAYESIKIQK